MGAEEYNKFLRKEKNRIFEKYLFSWRTKEQILNLYKEGYSPTQVARLFKHEVGFKDICEHCSTFHGKKPRTFRVFSSFTTQIFAHKLKPLIPYLKEFHDIHLSKHQWWKIRFAHLDKSENEVKEIATTQILNWQKSTCEKRKKSGTYNPIYTIEYWKYLSDDPQRSIEQYKRSISPRCIEFWVKKGYDLNEAKKRVGDVCRPGAFATLKNLYGTCTSKLEKRIYELVDDASVGQQLFLGKYAYDLYKREVKKIVEINGTYWHADPRVYQDESKKLVHGTVQEIRLKDEQKISYAKLSGWDVLIVWEFDYCKSPNDVIESIIRFFKNE